MRGKILVTPDEYEEKIADLDAKAEDQEERLESIRQRLVSAIAEFAEDWFAQQAREEVERHSSTALELGDEKMKAMKRDVEDLVGRAEELAEDYFGDPSLWDHLEDRPDVKNRGFAHRYHFYREDRGPDVINSELKSMLGKLGKVLESHGLISVTHGRSGARGWKKEYNSGISYSIDVSWSERMLEEMENYSNLHDEYMATLRTLDQTRKEKREDEATDMWDEA